MNQKLSNALIEDTTSSLESKFDTPGPGTYNIRGQFRSNITDHN